MIDLIDQLSVNEERVLTYFTEHPGDNWEQAAQKLGMDAKLVFNISYGLVLKFHLERIQSDGLMKFQPRDWRNKS